MCIWGENKASLVVPYVFPSALFAIFPRHLLGSRSSPLTRMHFNTCTFTKQNGAKQAYRACNSLCQQHFVTCKKLQPPPDPKEKGTTRMSRRSPWGRGASCCSLPPPQQPPISPQPHSKALHKAPCRLHGTSRSGGRPLRKSHHPKTKKQKATKIDPTAPQTVVCKGLHGGGSYRPFSERLKPTP